VPELDTIYIDKPLQKHNLIQTISRVNRKLEGKSKGLVVDYIGIKRQMNQALAMYSRIDATNFEDIQQSVIEVKNHLDLLAQVFHDFDSRAYFSGEPQAQLACLNQAAEFVMRTQKTERRFMGLVKRLKAAYDVCCGSEALSQAERDHIHFYIAVRSIVFKLTKGDAPDVTQMNARVREMIADALKPTAWKSCFSLATRKRSRSIFSTKIIWRALIRSNCRQPKSSCCKSCWKKPSATLKKSTSSGDQLHPPFPVDYG
jgi:type I restriction enzyme R subunit